MILSVHTVTWWLTFHLSASKHLFLYDCLSSLAFKHRHPSIYDSYLYTIMRLVLLSHWAWFSRILVHRKSLVLVKCEYYFCMLVIDVTMLTRFLNLVHVPRSWAGLDQGWEYLPWVDKTTPGHRRWHGNHWNTTFTSLSKVREVYCSITFLLDLMMNLIVVSNKYMLVIIK